MTPAQGTRTHRVRRGLRVRLTVVVTVTLGTAALALTPVAALTYPRPAQAVDTARSALLATGVPEAEGTPGADPDPDVPPVTEPPATDPPSQSPTPEPPPTEPPSPSSPPPAAPSPTPSPPAAQSPTPPPPVATSAPGQPRPPQTGPARVGVSVTTGDVTLGPAYWNAASTVADLQVTVTNTGQVTELLRLRYTLPAGLSDAGTAGCAATGDGGHRCAGWTTAAGARFSTRIRVRVDDDAWRSMPLSGSVQVEAAPSDQSGQAAVTDTQGFAVLFPPGPPVPGMSLAAEDVGFDVTGQPSALEVRLGNTGRTDATGAVEVILPAGVSVAGGHPAGCRATGAGRTRCDLGTVRAGQVSRLRLPVAATAEAQRSAPLSGAVVGMLAPRSGAVKRMQMSFRITAVAATAVDAAVVTPTGSQGALTPVVPLRAGGGLNDVQKTAIALIAVSVLLVLLALGLATTSLRRRMRDAPATEDVVVPAD